jgi:arylsulfatase A-like enzyme
MAPTPAHSSPGPRHVVAPILLALAAGCGERETTLSGPVRLVDLEPLGRADARGAAVLGDPSTGGASRYAGELLADPPAQRFSHSGTWVEAVVRSVDDGVLGRVEGRAIAVQPAGTLRVRAHVPVDAAAGQLFAIELETLPSEAQLADAAWVQRLFRELGSFQHALVARGADAGRATLECVFTAHSTTNALILGRAIDAGAPPPSIEFEVLQFDERGGWLQSTALAGRPAHVRSVSAASETREALVLGVGAALRFEFEVPSGKARLEAGVSVHFASQGEARPLALEVRARAEDHSEELRLPLDGSRPGWQPLELDLEDLAGKRIELSLEVRAADGRPDRALVALGAPIVEGSGSDGLPDVVLVSLDTVRADRSSAYGYARPTTPALAELAREAAVFDNAVTTAPWTLPAHVSVFSGQYPDRHRAFGRYSHVALETPWLVEEFRRAGYRTAAYTGGGYVDPQFGFARGFDVYACDDPAFPPAEWLAEKSEREGSAAPGPARARAQLGRLLGGERRSPRFLFVHTYAAHNYLASSADLLAVGARSEQLAELWEGVNPSKLEGELYRLEDQAQAPRLRANASLLYDGALRVADRLVADVVAALRESDRLEDTILVVFSDHGEELFERGRIGHGSSTYEEMVRVPLLIRAPGLAPVRVGDVVSLVDLAPTLRELAGLRRDPARASLDDGVSLLPRMRGEPLGPRAVLARGDVRDRVFRCLRGDDLKLVRETRLETPPVLRVFRLGEDPSEAHDLSAREPDAAQALEQELVERVRRLEALGPAGLEAEVSGELLQQLRNLGYLGD